MWIYLESSVYDITVQNEFVHLCLYCALCRVIWNFIVCEEWKKSQCSWQSVVSNYLERHTKHYTAGNIQPITWKPFGLRLRGFSEATFSFPSTTFIRLSVFLTYCRSLYVRRSSTSIDWLMFWTCYMQTHTHMQTFVYVKFKKNCVCVYCLFVSSTLI